MATKKVTVSWECPKCGHRHAWKWREYDAGDGEIWMSCDKCSKVMSSELRQIGKSIWVAIWPYKLITHR